jgi:hypothetical protein
MQNTILAERYFISEEIAAGGMGTVYRATDLHTGGEVAVKVPHEYFARDPQYVERLRREAEVAASIHSPRVVRVIDLFMHESVPCLVMEYVPGDTLAGILRRHGRFSLRDTLTLGLEVARAMDAAHAKGIVHRDLKPQNIKLVDGQVKVLDFGIAKGEGFADVTAVNVFVGTPEYCAPERIEGGGDIRSDIYALGVILFEMSEGRLPFEGATPVAIMKKHESEPPPSLSDETPPAVQEIILRCLAKEPERRYQSPRELAQALRTVLDVLGTGPQAALSDTLPGTLDQPIATDPAIQRGDSLGQLVAASTATVGGTASGAAHESIRPQPRRTGAVILPLLGILAAIVAGGVIAAVIVGDRGGRRDAADTGGSDRSSAAAVDEGTALPASTRATPADNIPPLLIPGEPRSLAGVAGVTIPISNPACSGVRLIYQPTAIEVDSAGRVTVSYAVEAPRIEGLECGLDVTGIDATCACMVLQTRLSSGRVVEARNSGGTGIAAHGAQDVYGAGSIAGSWVFDRGVDLTGDQLTLLRVEPGQAVPTYRIPLLRRTD